MITLAVEAKARYSASANEREIVCRFLDRQDTSDSPRKTRYPVTKWRVSKHESQSTLEKARSFKEDEVEKNNP